MQDLHFDIQNKILFILLSKSTIKSKVENFFSQITGNQYKNQVYGLVIAFRLDFEQPGDYPQLWKKEYYSPPKVMCWEKDLTILAVGQYNGNIDCIRVKQETNFDSFDDFCQIKRHTDFITGLVMNSHTAKLYSVSNDKYCLTTDISTIDDQVQVEEKMV